MKTHLALGIGCREQASADEIVSLVREVLRSAQAYDIETIFTLARKAEHLGLRDAAMRLGCDLRFLDEGELLSRQAEFSARGAAPSAMVEAATGLKNVAEAAALMGGGPKAVLIVKKRASANVTCAIAATTREAVELVW